MNCGSSALVRCQPNIGWHSCGYLGSIWLMWSSTTWQPSSGHWNSQITRAEFSLALKARSRAARRDEWRCLLLILLAGMSWHHPRCKSFCLSHTWMRKVGEKEKKKVLQKEAFRSTKCWRKWVLIFTLEKGILDCRLCTDVCVLHLGYCRDSIYWGWTLQSMKISQCFHCMAHT